MSALEKIKGNSFAAECYATRNIVTLKQLLRRPVYPGDLMEWKITASEWREQVQLAIAALEETK